MRQLREHEQELLMQRTQAWFPAPTVIVAHNHLQLKVQGTQYLLTFKGTGHYVVHIHICKKNIHTHEIINKIKVIRAKLVVFAYDSNRLEAEAG